MFFHACRGCRCRFWRSRRCRLCIWNRLWYVSNSLHFLLQDKLSLHDCQKNWITNFTTCNKSNARTLIHSVSKSRIDFGVKTKGPSLSNSCPPAPRLMQPFSPGTSVHRPQGSLWRQQWWACRPGQAPILQFSRQTLQVNSRCGSHGIKLFPVFKPPTYQEGPTDSLLLNGLLWVLTVQEIFVCLQICLQLSDYSFHSEPRAVEEEFFLELLDPFMDAHGFRWLP